MKNIFWTLSAGALLALAAPTHAATVTIANGTGGATWNCGSLSNLSVDGGGNVSITIASDSSCTQGAGGTGGGNTGGGNTGGGNTGGGNTGGGNTGGGNTGGGNTGGGNTGGGNTGGGNTGGGTTAQCVQTGNIVCKGAITGMPNFEQTDKTIQPGEIHVYSFVFHDSFGKAKLAPVFGGLKIIKISATPGDLSPTTDGCYRNQRNSLQKVYYEPASLSSSPWACDLQDGQTYFVNFKTKLNRSDVYRLLGNQGGF